MTVSDYQYNCLKPDGKEVQISDQNRKRNRRETAKWKERMSGGYLLASPRTGELRSKTVFISFDTARLFAGSYYQVISRRWYERNHKIRIALPKLKKLEVAS